MAGTYGVTETTGTERSQLVASEAHEQKPITVASGAGALVRGTVLGVVTASYKHVQFNPGGADGSEAARAILAEDVDATAADKTAEAHFTGKYRSSDLVWPGSITDAQKKAALLQLQDRGIIVDTDWA